MFQRANECACTMLVFMHITPDVCTHARTPHHSDVVMLLLLLADRLLGNHFVARGCLSVLTYVSVMGEGVYTGDIRTHAHTYVSIVKNDRMTFQYFHSGFFLRK